MIKIHNLASTLALGAAVLAGPAQAAPDGTLGTAILSASVNSSGALISGAGATGSSNLFTGAYEVDFNRNVSGCFYNAVSFTGTVAFVVQPRSGNPNGVFVEFSTLGNTTPTNPTLTNSQFYMTVYCGR